MSFTVKTLDETHAFLLDLARALLPTRDWSRFSFGWKWTRILAAGVTDAHAHIDAAYDDLLPDTAILLALDRWGAIRGIARKGATPARKSAALRVSGNGNLVVGDQLIDDATGLLYQVNEIEVVVTSADVDIVAISTGSATRLLAGAALRFVSAPAGIDEDAELVLDLDEDGEDAEGDDAYRARILDRFANPPLGGSQNDFVQWALEVTGVASAYCYPIRQGLGSVDLAALHAGTGTSRLLSGGEISDLQDVIDAERPVACKSFRVLTVDVTPTDIEVLIEPNGEARFVFDWDDGTPPAVASIDSATKKVTLAADRPASMEAGDRVIVKTALGTGEQFTIESLSSTDAFILEKWPSVDPAAADLVYAGGPLVDAVRNAVLDHVNHLGTSNPDGNRYGAWEANLRPENLYRMAQSTEGVSSSSVAAPVTTVEPADNPYPDDGTVYIATPRRVIVRWKH